jgi:5-methylcytosine-specific restriction endonuclease McrA
MKEAQCRPKAKKRSRGLCERCAHGGSLTLHHRKKRSQGGTWDLFNVGMLCGHGTAGCHGWVESNPNAAEAEGWHVRPWQDPAEIKVKYQGQWALLLPDGEIEFD